jgi:bifunctional ADP-heptose synthase (sugar kinase/adenylyltransferase)
MKRIIVGIVQFLIIVVAVAIFGTLALGIKDRVDRNKVHFVDNATASIIVAKVSDKAMARVKLENQMVAKRPDKTIAQSKQRNQLVAEQEEAESPKIVKLSY